MSIFVLHRSPEEDRDYSDVEDFPNTIYHTMNRPQSRRGSGDLSRNGPMVRRIGSRQMLVLGDDKSTHGNSYCSGLKKKYCTHLLIIIIFLTFNRSCFEDLVSRSHIFVSKS